MCPKQVGMGSQPIFGVDLGHRKPPGVEKIVFFWSKRAILTPLTLPYSMKNIHKEHLRQDPAFQRSSSEKGQGGGKWGKWGQNSEQ